MTAPGAGQNINLAALWIPVMPDTAHMGEEMRKAGGEAKSQFEQGFNSSGSSPENIGQSFGSKLISSINREMKGLELPLGTSGVFEKLNGEVDKNAEKLRGKASEALQKYSEEYDKLGAAQARAAEAEQKVSAARDGGFNKASIMIPLIQEQAAAEAALKEAHVNTSAALEDYNGKLGKLSAAHEEAGRSGGMMAGIVGGAVVVGVGLAISAVDKLAESVIEGAVEAFKMGVEGAKEFADKMVELGETYEHIGIQITEFSDLNGEAFESTEKAAQQVFSNLDVAGVDTGKTMVQLAESLNAPGEEIKSLVTHVEELQGRFTDLKSADLAHIFHDFEVPAENADSALASLLQSARGSGQDIGQLTQALSGIAGLTLKEAGLNLQQSGAFMADMLKYGEPGRQVMTGLASAMKEFGKEGLSFEDGMKLAGQRLKDLGDTAEGQDMAEKLFGTRNWIVAKDAVQEYMNVVGQGPDAFNANASSLDEFVEKTRTLENEWEIVKHKAEEAFLPMGLEAVKLAGSGLDSLVEFVKGHMDQIKAAVKGGGDFIIKFASQTEQLAIGVLEFFSPVVGAIERMMSGALISLGDFANVTGQILSYIPGMHDIGQGMSDAGKAADGFGHDLAKVDVGKGMGDLAEWLKQHPIDVDKATESWDKFADHVGTDMDSSNEAVSKAGGWFKAAPDGVSAPEAGTGRLSTSRPGAGTPIGPMPAIAGAGNLDSALQGQGLSPGMIRLIKAFSTVEGNNPAGNPTLGFVDSQLGGASDTQSHVAALLKQFQDRSGVAGAFPEGGTDQQQAEWIAKVVGQNGSPSDWQGNQQPKDYVQRVIAAMGVPAAPPSPMGPAEAPPATPIGPTPALPQMPGDQVTYTRQEMDKLGIAPLYQNPAGGGAPQIPDWVQQFVQRFGGPGLVAASTPHGSASGSGLHGAPGTEGFAVDVTGPQAQQDALAAVLKANPALSAMMIHQGADGTDYGVAGGQDVSGRYFNTAGGTYGDEAGMVHWAPSFDGSGSTPGGKNGAAYPGLPGQFGGLGVYGGETADQAFSAAQAVQEAQDRQSDLDYTVSKNQQRITDLKQQLADVGNDPSKTGLLTGKPLARTPAEQAADDKKRQSLQRELDDATHQLTVSQREQSEQGAKITEAQRKQQEAMYKKPTGTQAGGNKDAQSLGSGLLSGISEELGLGTVFGKSPLDWGIVKLAEGLFNYANGLGDAIFGQTNGGIAGGTPGGSQGLGGGLVNGLLGSVGIKAPTAMLSAGPNVVPGTPIGAAGTGGGPLPGPPIVNQDNSINISPNVDPSAILPPVIGMQRDQTASANASSFTQTGGFPAP